MSNEPGDSTITRRWLAALLLALVVAGALAVAQGRRGGRFGPTVTLATDETMTPEFQFCRVMFRANRNGDGGGWGVDFPRADINLSIRLSELTKTRVGMDASGTPRHVVLRLTDEALYRCPFIMMTEVGAAFLDDQEAAALRDYLLKGGFLWTDDFWGDYAWDAWLLQLARVLPRAQYPVEELPLDHPLFRAQFVVKGVPQIPSINFWGGVGGPTSERGAESATPHARAIADAEGRIMVLMTHNTDVGDSWEREGDDPAYFTTFSVNGYAFGINVLLYAMSH